MVIFSGLFTAFGRLMGAVAMMTVGWATILLFGRVPQSRQTLLSFISLGSLVWVVAIAGVLIPAAGDLLVASIPRPPVIQTAWLRLALVALALLTPLAIGLATSLLVPTEVRPKGRSRAEQILRGYPYAAVFAVTLVFRAVWSLQRKIHGMQHKCESAHIPMMVKPGRYDAVVARYRGGPA